MNYIINEIIEFFSILINYKFGKEFIVFVVSILPVLELRGGLIAAALLDLDPVKSYIISIIGNLVPVPFILFFINKILLSMKNSKSKFLNGFSNKLYNKVEKHKKEIEKHGYWSLALFVGIPLPGTGAWTGCLVAAVLNMDLKKSFLSIFIGVIIASIIMMVLSFGLLKSFI